MITVNFLFKFQISERRNQQPIGDEPASVAERVSVASGPASAPQRRHLQGQ